MPVGALIAIPTLPPLEILTGLRAVVPGISILRKVVLEATAIAIPATILRLEILANCRRLGAAIYNVLNTCTCIAMRRVKPTSLVTSIGTTRSGRHSFYITMCYAV
jgi:hypothetical protein